MSELAILKEGALNGIKLMVQGWVKESVEEVMNRKLSEAIQDNENQKDERLTVKEVAQECKVKTTTVRDWCRKDKIKYERVGERYLILRSSLNLFLRSRSIS